MVSPFPSMFGGPEDAPGDPPQNFVSIASVGQDASDPSRAFMFVDSSGQVLVECRLEPDGDKVQAYLCLAQSGPNAGDFIPVAYGDAVLLVWPDSEGSPYLVARLNDDADPLATSVAGISTRGPSGQVRCFRWTVTPAGQVYAIAPTGELYLAGGASGVRLSGAQILASGPTHLGADFVSPPVPGQVAGGAQESAPTPAGPYVPPQSSTLTTPPFAGNAKAIVRVTDGVQSNIAIDEYFWLWVAAVNAFITAAAAILGLPWTFADPPTALESQHKSASLQHTALD